MDGMVVSQKFSKNDGVQKKKTRVVQFEEMSKIRTWLAARSVLATGWQPRHLSASGLLRTLAMDHGWSHWRPVVIVSRAITMNRHCSCLGIRAKSARKRLNVPARSAWRRISTSRFRLVNSGLVYTNTSIMVSVRHACDIGTNHRFHSVFFYLFCRISQTTRRSETTRSWGKSRSLATGVVCKKSDVY